MQLDLRNMRVGTIVLRLGDFGGVVTSKVVELVDFSGQHGKGNSVAIVKVGVMATIQLINKFGNLMENKRRIYSSSM